MITSRTTSVLTWIVKTSDFFKHISPESWQNLPGFQSPLHLVPAGFTHLPQDIKTPQPQHQLRQKLVAFLVAHHFRFQHLLHAGHAVVRVQAVTQVEESPALTAAESFCYLIDRLKVVLILKSHGLR